jgi:transcriptional regulator with GAF, ATPase, and Fis domain
VAVNCAAIPATLFESELFGHEAGSFTGAKGARPGLFEAAADGTLFLDEVGELPSDLQPKLLRALETRQFRRVGGTRPLPLSARIVSATNRGLNGVRDSTLRLDLHFRLAGFTIELPPLRDRLGDVELLARSFLEAFVRRNRTAPIRLSEEATDALGAHDWPGNVRELKAVVERSAIVARGDVIQAQHVYDALGRAVERVAHAEPANDCASTANDTAGISGLRRIEKDLVLAVFEDSHKNLSLAARVLGVPRSTLRDKLRRYGAM